MYAGAGYRVLEKRLPSAVTTLHRSYDGDRRVTRHDQRRTTDDQRISGFTYAWDRVGNRHYERTLTNNTNTSETGGDGEAFTYDSVYRMRGYYQDVASASLNSVSNNSPELGVSLTYTGTYRSYDLDGVGNRVDVSADGVVESAYLLEGDDASTNQYTFIDDAFQAYDSAGNLLDDGDRQFSYGHRNQLLRAVKDSTDARYRHDVLGRRVSKRLSSGNFSGWSYGHSVYVHFGSDLIEEYDTSGNLRKEWIYGIRIDEPIRMRAPDYADLDDDEKLEELVDLYYLTNSLGTVTALIDTSGNVAERYVYDVWGVILDVIDSDGSSTGASWTLVGNPWCYTGRQFEFEERSGLYHYRARAYRPEVGQFVQRDPLGVWGDAGNRGGSRTYAAATPANWRDWSGLAGEFVFADVSEEHGVGPEPKEGGSVYAKIYALIDEACPPSGQWTYTLADYRDTVFAKVFLGSDYFGGNRDKLSHAVAHEKVHVWQHKQTWEATKAQLVQMFPAVSSDKYLGRIEVVSQLEKYKQQYELHFRRSATERQAHRTGVPIPDEVPGWDTAYADQPWEREAHALAWDVLQGNLEVETENANLLGESGSKDTNRGAHGPVVLEYEFK